MAIKKLNLAGWLIVNQLVEGEAFRKTFKTQKKQKLMRLG
jgi:hypothetical protein